ncbi:hypothetical protein YB2330_003014 [Saitoella coloradoensis]
MSWRVLHGKTKDAPWQRLREPADRKAFIRAVNVERLLSKIDYQAFVTVETNYMIPRGGSSTDEERRSTQGRKRTKKQSTAPYKGQRTTTREMLQDVTVRYQNSTLDNHRMSAVAALQEKGACKRHSNPCYIHPVTKTHRRISHLQQSRWAEAIVTPSSGVTVDQPPINDSVFNELHQAFLASDSVQGTPLSSQSSIQGVLSMPVPASPSPLVAPSTVTTDQSRVEPPERVFSSPLQGEERDDLTGFLVYVKKHSPTYTHFDIDIARQGIIENGLRLDDLKLVPKQDLGVLKMGWLITMQEFWPHWKKIQRNVQGVRKALDVRPNRGSED